jgi:hypothetical protein
MLLGSVGRVEGVNISYLDSHADASILGKEAMIFNDYDHKVTVNGYDPAGETMLLRIVSVVLGYVIPYTWRTVLLIIHQGIYLQNLEHNLFSTMQMRLHGFIVNETPKFRCLEPTNISHTISVRYDNVDDVLIITFYLHSVMSCFETFKLTKEEFDTCEKYELKYESPEYDLKSSSKQEADIMDSWGRLKLPGDSHPRWLQVCTLRQKDMTMMKLSVAFSDTYIKLQYLYVVLDDSGLILELRRHIQI